MLNKFKQFLAESEQEFTLLEMSANDVGAIENALNIALAPLRLKFEFAQHTKNRILDVGQQGRRDGDRGATANHSHFAQTGNVKADYSNARDADIDPRQIVQMFKMMLYRHGDYIKKQKDKRKEFVGTIIGKEGLNISFKIDYQYYKPENLLRIITLMQKKGFIPHKDDVVFRL